ncbi:MAG: DNA-processing protein DprA [Lachnospiraceae bacterium]|nr:DNA-processing protein DprA [Lachnospiraceae bacterium]
MANTEWDYFRLVNIKGIGSTSVRKLLDSFDDIEAIFNASKTELENVIEHKAETFLLNKDSDEIKRNYERIKDKNINFIHLEDKRYPDKLRELYDKPIGLYVMGRLPKKENLNISIIGARQASNYGLEMARYFARELAKNGVNVISGLAYGADSMAHRGALEAGGYTLGVLGSGINICYPKENYDIYEQMKEKGGIVSENGLDTKPSAGLFPIRNRIIAAMSDGILVTEAREKSGTLITVDQGLELGRDIFAIPGRNGEALSLGCNRLIQNGAKLVTNLDDILDEYRQLDKEPDDIRLHVDAKLSKEERFIYEMLDLDPAFVEIIIEKSHMSPPKVLRILLELENMGLVKRVNGSYYSVVI